MGGGVKMEGKEENSGRRNAERGTLKEGWRESGQKKKKVDGKMGGRQAPRKRKQNNLAK